MRKGLILLKAFRKRFLCHSQQAAHCISHTNIKIIMLAQKADLTGRDLITTALIADGCNAILFLYIQNRGFFPFFSVCQIPLCFPETLKRRLREGGLCSNQSGNTLPRLRQTLNAADQHILRGLI